MSVTPTTPAADLEDTLVRAFVRSHGHPPTSGQLADYRRARNRARIQLAARVRRRAARALTRL